MCSIFLAYQAHPRYRVVVAANRDEFFERPTTPAGYWDDASGVLAGRDLRGGGTWLGLGQGQRFAAVTNYRDPAAPPGRRSRGELVAGFISGVESPTAYLNGVAHHGNEYSGFNLFAADGEQLCYFSNRDSAPRALLPGVYGLSNHLLDTPWPKVERGRARLSEIVASKTVIDPGDLFDLLADEAQAPDADLPDTGIGLERERALSSIFIRTPDYGTRSATVVLIEKDGVVSFTERTFDRSSADFSDRHFDIPRVNAHDVGQLVAVAE